MGEGSPKLRSAYKTYTYTTYIHNNFPSALARKGETSPSSAIAENPM